MASRRAQCGHQAPASAVAPSTPARRILRPWQAEAPATRTPRPEGREIDTLGGGARHALERRDVVRGLTWVHFRDGRAHGRGRSTVASPSVTRTMRCELGQEFWRSGTYTWTKSSASSGRPFTCRATPTICAIDESVEPDAECVRRRDFGPGSAGAQMLRSRCRPVQYRFLSSSVNARPETIGSSSVSK